MSSYAPPSSMQFCREHQCFEADVLGSSAPSGNRVVRLRCPFGNHEHALVLASGSRIVHEQIRCEATDKMYCAQEIYG